MADNKITTRQHTADEIDVAQELSQLESICHQLIDKAKSLGATEVDVGVGKDIGLSVQVRNQDVETLEYNRDNSFGLTVYFGQQKGTATTSDLSEAALTQTVEAACNIAKYTQADPASGLADESLMATKPVDLELDKPMGITADKAKELALECEQAGMSASSEISQSEGATFSSHRNIRFYANSHGFSAGVPSTRYSLSNVLIAEEEAGMQRDYWYTIARDATRLEPPEVVGKKAAQRVIARLGGHKISTRKCPVLMTPDIARGLIGSLSDAIQGSSIYRKSSFLLDKLNLQIFPEFVSMHEKPFKKQGFASTWFDNEGVATKEQFIVENGLLQTYLLTSYAARRLNMKPTGHAGGLHNIEVTASAGSFDSLVKQMERGLIVTEVMGQGVNLVNGDYSRGASGFWVENGEIQHFVQEITIAGNLADMFAGLVATGSDYDNRSSIYTGSWLIEEMTIAGS
ncbi:metalloprotease PmbA [Aliikangiella marina]|uniref:Metalloprotease PmbA n=1 Tax=Aliikangiella marina TaxID=1712262 RepID=A0A545TDU4_9GAMM|nr:metalloprotease PmbA [Aliikangiella marina]TQV75389.1 metalloprotease PmbA [Aliikangiella marina]